MINKQLNNCQSWRRLCSHVTTTTLFSFFVQFFKSEFQILDETQAALTVIVIRVEGVFFSMCELCLWMIWAVLSYFCFSNELDAADDNAEQFYLASSIFMGKMLLKGAGWDVSKRAEVDGETTAWPWLLFSGCHGLSLCPSTRLSWMEDKILRQGERTNTSGTTVLS